MSQAGETPEPMAWQPATSAPGELYTIEGQIRATGAFARGLKRSDPRLRPYRRAMRRTAYSLVACAVALVAIILGVRQLF